MTDDVVIVGGGLAAVRTAQALRSKSSRHEGRIIVLSDEDEAPYDRPPLSKKYLLGEVDDDAIALIAEDKLAELEIDVRLSRRAVGVDRARHVVLLEGGEEIGYGTLIAATGAGAALLPALQGFDNVHVLRSAADSRRLRDELGEGVRLGIVGGGFIGLEIAAVALQRGCSVTVLEGAPAPLAPVLGAELGGHVQRWHEGMGVGFECGSFLKAAHGSGGRASELELENGTRVEVDVVVAGVGARRNTDWLQDSGLELHDGLVVDDFGRTADPAVFGVGDVVCFRTPEGDHHPSGHWTAATEQARRVAKAIVSDEEQDAVVHDFYFWSDQHDKRLQFLGTVPAAPTVTFTVGGPDDERYVAVIGDGEHMTGVFSLGMPKDFMKTSMPLRRGEKVPVPGR